MTDDMELSRIVSRGVYRWKKKVIKDMDEIDALLLGIVHQTPDEALITGDRCTICESKEDKADLERHHLGRVDYDHRTVTACIAKGNCHGTLTKWQRVWPEYTNEAPQGCVRQEYFLRGLREILTLKAEAIGNPYYRLLGDEFVEDVRRLSKTNVKYLRVK